MTTDRTLPPPKTPPFFTCSNEWCNNKYQAYHGKVGCKCYSCDNKTPFEIRKPFRMTKIGGKKKIMDDKLRGN